MWIAYDVLPLSDMIEWKISNQYMMFFQMYLEVLASVILARGSTFAIW